MLLACRQQDHVANASGASGASSLGVAHPIRGKAFRTEPVSAFHGPVRRPCEKLVARDLRLVGSEQPTLISRPESSRHGGQRLRRTRSPPGATYNMNIAEFFDENYRSEERYWWRESVRYSGDPADYPHSLLTQMTLRLIADCPPGRALDLGAGEGTDSIRLALMGYDVDAVEISKVGAEKIKWFA